MQTTANIDIAILYYLRSNQELQILSRYFYDYTLLTTLGFFSYQKYSYNFVINGVCSSSLSVLQIDNTTFDINILQIEQFHNHRLSYTSSKSSSISCGRTIYNRYFEKYEITIIIDLISFSNWSFSIKLQEKTMFLYIYFNYYTIIVIHSMNMRDIYCKSREFDMVECKFQTEYLIDMF